MSPDPTDEELLVDLDAFEAAGRALVAPVPESDDD